MKTLTIKYKLTAPVSHIGETASTGSYFQTINTSGGRLPVITGNSVRGILRDKLAAHLLETIGMSVDKETFNVLFSGGNISGSTKNDVQRAKQVREHFPMISLLGGGLGTMIMSGNLVSGFVYPVCRESEFITGIESDTSWHDLIDDIEFTRMDDAKNDKNSGIITDIDADQKAKASTQMRFSVQYLSAGTEMVQNIVLLDSASEIEEAALWTAIKMWFDLPVLGGMKAKGFGTFSADVNCGRISVDSNGNISASKYVSDMIDSYNDFIRSDNSSDWLYLLKDGGKNGKA